MAARIVENSKLIKREYDAVLELCARLIGFAAALPVATDTDDLIPKQEALASVDLVALSIHARRFITLVGVKKSADHAKIPHLSAIVSNRKVEVVDKHTYTNVWDLLGVLGHYAKLDFITSTIKLLPRTRSDDELIALMRRKHDTVRPKLVVQSDRSDLIFVDLQHFILVFLERVFNPAVQKCADEKVFLENWLLE